MRKKMKLNGMRRQKKEESLAVGKGHKATCKPTPSLRER